MQIGQPWLDRWQQIAQQLISDAANRGGTGDSSGLQVRLHAPGNAEGTCLRIIMLEEETAVIAGEGFRAACSWSLKDDHNQEIVNMATAIMDGRAEVSDTGLYRIPGLGSSYDTGNREPNWRTLPAWQAAKPGGSTP